MSRDDHGKFKTDWFQQQNHKWNGESNIPYTYVIYNSKRHKPTDFDK